MASGKFIRNFVEGAEPYPGVSHQVGCQPLQHQQYLRPAAYIRVNGNWEHRLVVLPIDVVKLVAPHLFNVPGIYKSVTVGRFLNEHHRRQIVQIPGGGNLDQVSFMSPDQAPHPGIGWLREVDFGPVVPDSDAVAFKVPMHQAVVILDSMLDQQLIGPVAELPPGRNVSGWSSA